MRWQSTTRPVIPANVTSSGDEIGTPPGKDSMTREAFVQRMSAATLGAFDVAATYLGLKLGFYRSLADDGPATAAELAGRTGTDERLVREWLEQQGATELLTATNDGGEWRFGLPPGHADVLLDPDALDGIAGTMLSLVAELVQVPRLVESFRTGVGIPYADYGPDEAEGQAMGTRPIYRTEIRSWFAAVPDLAERLAAGSARVLDIGCGTGWSSVSIARAYPGVRVDGVDLNPGSIAAARQVAAGEGVTDRVTFDVRDAATLAGAG
jgi:hypothetical protein